LASPVAAGGGGFLNKLVAPGNILLNKRPILKAGLSIERPADPIDEG
jgi:hypothetical protein